MTTTAVARTPNDFAADLYGRLAARPGNLLFSPYSVNIALGMALAGARGETREQLAQVLGAGEDWRQTYAGLIAEAGGERPYRVTTANRLLAHTGYVVREDYQAVLREVFGGEITRADFLADPDGVVADVNRWVSQKTNGKITGLIGRHDVSPATRLILLNAVHLLAEWADPFPRANTRDDTFTLAGGTQARVPLMSRTGGFRFAETEEAQYLEIPYKGNGLAMLLCLPRTRDGLPGLEAGWDRKAHDAVVSALGEEEVEVFLPRFRVATAVIRLKGPLCEMGAGVAFGVGDEADFSGIGEEPLTISEVLHKAFIEVDEEKTEAAAATAVVFTIAISMPSPPKVFRADRPFRFDIRNNQTGAILFSGRVADPRG
jgi:serpin B